MGNQQSNRTNVTESIYIDPSKETAKIASFTCADGDENFLILDKSICYNGNARIVKKDLSYRDGFKLLTYSLDRDYTFNLLLKLVCHHESTDDKCANPRTKNLLLNTRTEYLKKKSDEYLERSKQSVV